MCWGAFCTDQGDGAIGTTLTYDAPSPDTTNARYKAACQTPKNRCSGNGDHNSCDEYPFKQTNEADIEDAVSRCVTTNAQSSKSMLPSYKQLHRLYHTPQCHFHSVEETHKQRPQTHADPSSLPLQSKVAKSLPSPKSTSRATKC